MRDIGGSFSNLPSPLCYNNKTKLKHPPQKKHRRRGIFDTDFLALLAHVVLGTILSKVVPFLYGKKPALLQLGSGERPQRVGMGNGARGWMWRWLDAQRLLSLSLCF